MNTLYSIFKFIIGFLLALVLIAGASVAGALYFAAKLQQPPVRPTFPNDQPSPSAPAQSAQTTPPQPAPAPSPTPTPLAPGTYRAVVVQPIGLIVRDNPSRNADRIGGVGYQEEVIVLEETPNKDWQRVRVLGEENLEGWVIGGNTEAVAN